MYENIIMRRISLFLFILMSTVMVLAQERVITGVVLDGEFKGEPLIGANVTVGQGQATKGVITDLDGITEKISLGAPPRDASLSPGAPERPYSTYDVEIIKEGFLTKRILGISIFAGIDAFLPIAMLPLEVGGSGGTVTLTVTQNESLE